MVFFFFSEEADCVVAGGDSGVGGGVEAGSDVGRGVSGGVAAAGFVTGAVAVFFTGEMVAGLVSPGFWGHFLPPGHFGPAFMVVCFELDLTRALFLLVWLLADGGGGCCGCCGIRVRVFLLVWVGGKTWQCVLFAYTPNNADVSLPPPPSFAGPRWLKIGQI